MAESSVECIFHPVLEAKEEYSQKYPDGSVANINHEESGERMFNDAGVCDGDLCCVMVCEGAGVL